MAALVCASMSGFWLAPSVHAQASSAGSPNPTPVATASVATQVTTLNEVLHELSKISALRAKFREVKHLKLLKNPLIAEGAVYFAKPGWIARKTEKPEPSLLVLRDGELTVSDPSGKRVFDLSGSPVLRAFVEGFIDVLRGDRAALERNYELRFEAQALSTWRLVLQPRVAALARFLAELSFVGKGATVQHVSLREPSGDETLTEFSSVEMLDAFDAGERDRVFGPPTRRGPEHR